MAGPTGSVGCSVGRRSRLRFPLLHLHLHAMDSANNESEGHFESAKAPRHFDVGEGQSHPACVVVSKSGAGAGESEMGLAAGFHQSVLGLVNMMPVGWVHVVEGGEEEVERVRGELEVIR